ncbi:Hypothetical predicted protein, partial [Paramuricea clavata]
MPVALKTDHKPLVSALEKASDTATPFQRRHLSFVSQFSKDIAHQPGSTNVIADALSRSDPVDFLIDDEEVDDDDDDVLASIFSVSNCSPKDFLASQVADSSLMKWIDHHLNDDSSPFSP